MGSVLRSFSTIILLSVLSVSIASAKELVVTQSDNGIVLNLSVGDTLSIKLPAQLGNGYSWEVDTYSKESLKYLGTTVETEKSEPGAVSIQTFMFESKAKKSGSITIIYRRPFEKNRPPTKVFRIRIRVA